MSFVCGYGLWFSLSLNGNGVHCNLMVVYVLF
jgi:hypothetical protein